MNGLLFMLLSILSSENAKLSLFFTFLSQTFWTAQPDRVEMMEGVRRYKPWIVSMSDSPPTGVFVDSPTAVQAVKEVTNSFLFFCPRHLTH